MSGEPTENCAVAAVSLGGKPKDWPTGGAAFYLYKMLLAQQNRGQLSAGITTYNAERPLLLNTHKRLGIVNEVFRSREPDKMLRLLRDFSGSKGIGHIRYATCGSDSVEYAQPFERKHGRVWKWFSIAFNGNLANYAELKAELEAQKYHITLNTDTEIIQHFLAKQFIGEQKLDLPAAFANVSEKFDGSYSIVYLNAEGDIAAVRAPYGIKPLVFASHEGFTGAASESVALVNYVQNGIRDLKPGEMLLVENGSKEVKRFAKSPRNAHCMFEYVYFANAGSVLDGRSVYEARWAMGQELAKIEPLDVKSDDDYVVVGVPDTAKPAADAYANTLGLPSKEGLLRNRYVGRTFIESHDRLERVKEKYMVIKQVVKGKKVILVEDSIVRGTTSRELLTYIREKGHPREIHVRVSCPPIVAPCFYGIDMSTLDELIASRHLQREELDDGIGAIDMKPEQVEKIRKEINADSLVYQSKEGLVRAIGLENGAKDLCMACITGRYPTPGGQACYQKALALMGKSKGRTYEQPVELMACK
ncbi:MAG: amidophosphoribosyltransferase [Candidatus Diapherotrites archaeon]|uniref:Amidophosphoribosyltransferase n=2 Tax=Candidatus Iainarchaeum sp. TaxID=3101447 RepID=A0A8T4LIW3_9ARCH|nr:amidophosphoribosyltransferase [Candidatus Diapherotrites archaeon]